VFVQRGHELDRADWERFQTRAAQAGITPTVALLQCFGEALAVWSRSPRLTLNLTLFNRLPLHPDVDDVVGDFTSLLLLGIDELDNGTFEDRARRLQAELWQGVDNRYVSGVQVLRELAQMGDKVQPMMPIVFTSTLGIGATGQDSSSWHHLGEQVYSVSQTPQVWLDHVVSERDGALWYTWDVIEALFPPGLIDDLFAGYTELLTRLARDEAAWQSDWLTTQASMLPVAQREQRAAINATQSEIPAGLLHEGFLASTLTQPDAPAVISTERTLSYAELDTLSNQLAQQLAAAGAEPNQLIGVVMQKGWEQVVAVLGILKAGAAYLPIDAAMPTERLHYLLEFGEVQLAVTQRCQDAAIDWPANVQRFSVSDSDLANEPDELPQTERPVTQADIAYVIFTSGSTGLPKGVVIDHRGALNTCVDVNTRFNVQSGDRVLALSSLSFDLSVYDIFGLLAAGGAIVMPDAAGMRDPSHWAQLVAQHRVTIWNTVPALMGLLTEYAEQKAEPLIDSLRVVMMSGDWIPVKLPDRIRALTDADINSLGGATEASIWSIIYPIGQVPEHWTSIPYGKPMVNQTFHVLNTDLQSCPNLVPGELFIGGIGVALGYWRDEAKTNASFFVHPQTGERLYRTGDLGRYLPEGNIEFLGREDFQVKIQGFRVELGDIEAALESHPAVANAVVNAWGEARGDKRLAAYVVAAGDAAPDSETLRHWLTEKLPAYMVPAHFIALDTLPLSANGKVDRKQLPEPAAAQDIGQETARPAASSGATEILTKVVTDMLGATAIATDENLLQMGATSIEMIRIANALDQQLGFRPRMDDFYREPSIAGLAVLLEQQQPRGAAQGAAESARDPLLTPDWVLADIARINDPEDRNRFKDSRPGLRRFSESATRISLTTEQPVMEAYLRHRSYRDYSDEPVAAQDLGALLSKLQSIELDGKPKYLYASAGGLYPVQIYLYAKDGRCENLRAGSFYYDPANGDLIDLDAAAANVRSLYDPIINRPIFDQAAFALFLVADLEAIGAMYPDRAIHYATLEAGHITQLLEMTAPDHGIGLCQIGGLETEDFVDLLKLEKKHLVLHGLLGGYIAHDGKTSMAATSSDRDEGEI
jgi:amino acid adenylation domain-containing protein